MQTTNPNSSPSDLHNQLNAPTTLSDKPSDDDKPSFADLALAKPLLTALQKAGYTHPTPIQAQAIPPALAGRDLLLSAQTGSGKTAAFVLPILNRIIQNNQDAKTVRAVILTPTRELALQVQDNVSNYSGQARGIFSVALVGGAPYGGQIRALRKGVQIIVATPGRFIDHMNDGRIDLSSLDVLVLDEADRMLDMGFSEAIDTIITATPATRQTVMSSATWDGAVGKIAESFTSNPVRVAIKVESAHIDESVYFCDDFRHKNDILHEILNNPEINQAVIFAATKMSAEKLAGELSDKGYKARYLHGDLPQGKRNRIVSDVKAGKCQFLVATDVAARGIDIATISHVVNYDLPRQAEDYVHRIGRCGRAGRSGMAINLCSMDDRGQFFAINRYLGRQMKTATIAGLEPKRNFGVDERQKPSDRRSRHRNARNHAHNSSSYNNTHNGSPRSSNQGNSRFGQSSEPLNRYARRQTSVLESEQRWQDNKTKRNRPSHTFSPIQPSVTQDMTGKSPKGRSRYLDNKTHSTSTAYDSRHTKQGAKHGTKLDGRQGSGRGNKKSQAATETIFNQTAFHQTAKKRRFV